MVPCSQQEPRGLGSSFHFQPELEAVLPKNVGPRVSNPISSGFQGQEGHPHATQVTKATLASSQTLLSGPLLK